MTFPDSAKPGIGSSNDRGILKKKSLKSNLKYISISAYAHYPLENKRIKPFGFRQYSKMNKILQKVKKSKKKGRRQSNGSRCRNQRPQWIGEPANTSSHERHRHHGRAVELFRADPKIRHHCLPTGLKPQLQPRPHTDKQ